MNPIRRCTPLRTARVCAITAALATAAPLATQAADVEAFTAHPAVRHEIKDRCTALREADEGSFAVVLFLADASGSALTCVAKLKFQPATRPGDAVPVTTWQQLQLRWASPPAAPAATGPRMAAPASAATASAVTATAAPGAGSAPAITEVHVCQTPPAP
ncbi:MAG: hypothetical protein JSR36_00485 [Proteobacteria bacterium]|nr:hypothetical protein [Pseudomonadota bacterium]